MIQQLLSWASKKKRKTNKPVLKGHILNMYFTSSKDHNFKSTQYTKTAYINLAPFKTLLVPISIIRFKGSVSKTDNTASIPAACRCWFYFLAQRSFIGLLKWVHSGQIWETTICNKLNFYLLFFIIDSQMCAIFWLYSVKFKWYSPNITRCQMLTCKKNNKTKRQNKVKL